MMINNNSIHVKVRTRFDASISTNYYGDELDSIILALSVYSTTTDDIQSNMMAA